MGFNNQYLNGKFIVETIVQTLNKWSRVLYRQAGFFLYVRRHPQMKIFDTSCQGNIFYYNDINEWIFYHLILNVPM